MEYKICKKCLQNKDLSTYQRYKKIYKKSKNLYRQYFYYSTCKDCNRTKKSLQDKKYSEKHKIEKALQSKEYRIKNKEYLLMKNKEKYLSDKILIEKNKEIFNDDYFNNLKSLFNTIIYRNCKSCNKNKELNNNYFQEFRDYKHGALYWAHKCKLCYKCDVNVEAKNIKRKNKRKNDISFKIREIVAQSIRDRIQKGGKSTFKFLPYSPQELKNNIESLFEDWMTWENWGVYKVEMWDDNDKSTWIWQLDHIIPQSKLSYDSMEDENFKKCWAIDNLRPYSAKQNNIDRDRRRK